MKVLVCGGRDFKDGDLLGFGLRNLMYDNNITTIIHGGATGADYLAGVFAEMHGIKVEVYHADWRKHGRAAGPIRNRYMLETSNPDIVVAFDGGRGTANMISLAKKAGVPVMIVNKHGSFPA